MLMVIFGAGASYDSVEAARPDGTAHGHPDRPPLADELFEDRPRFTEMMTRYRDCLALIPRLRRREGGLSVEEMLGRLYDAAPTYTARHRQFAAIRFYLHAMMWVCQLRWWDTSRGITNHVTLLDQIDQWLPRYERVCLVTFNYDLLIEQALDANRIAIRSLPDYISHPRYKLIKAHGSINWGRELLSPELDPTKGALEVAFEMIERVEELKFAEELVWTGEHDMGRLPNQGKYVFPALAIPLVTKLDFECPAAHRNVLQECIPLVSKILVIGWRGAEKHSLASYHPSMAIEKFQVSLSRVIKGGQAK